MDICDRAAQYLVRSQSSDGHWQDYDIHDGVTADTGTPIGPSNQWVTAFVGCALAEYASSQGDTVVRQAAERGLNWLNASRCYPAGFGYNHRTGPDTDSTALAVLLTRRMCREPDERDLAFLRAAWRPGAGFATYPDGPGAWGQGQADLIGPALLALGDPPDDLNETLCALQSENGDWPSYWWANPHYATFWILDALHSLNIDAPPPLAPRKETLETTWIADLPYATGIALLRSNRRIAPEGLWTTLADWQDPRGSWPGSAALRVPAQTERVPWTNNTIANYQTDSGLMTTAHILSCLSRINAICDHDRTLIAGREALL